MGYVPPSALILKYPKILTPSAAQSIKDAWAAQHKHGITDKEAANSLLNAFGPPAICAYCKRNRLRDHRACESCGATELAD